MNEIEINICDIKSCKDFHKIFKQKVLKYYKSPLDAEAVMDCALYGDALIEWYYHENYVLDGSRIGIDNFRSNQVCLKLINFLCNQIKHCKRKGTIFNIKTEKTSGTFDPKFFDGNFFDVQRLYFKTEDGEEIYIDELMPKLEQYYDNLLEGR